MSTSALRNILIGLVILLIGATVYALASNGSDDASATNGSNEAKLVGKGELVSKASRHDSPVYWIGADEKAGYELTILDNGQAYVRYLADGAMAGDPRPSFLTVGTYQMADGLAALRRTARAAGAELSETKDGGMLLVSPSAPTSVYVAYPGADFQIEVYDPDPARALELASSGALEPVS